jgi:hypothetical protein
MTLYIDPAHIISDEFGELEPPKPEWTEQIAYWEDYVKKFFLSNGMVFHSSDSNVEQWLMAPDRAPFSEMVRQLLPRLSDQVDIGTTEAILFSHWLPDLHMGTSVTNFIMHQLGLRDCFGFAISDRGLSAPFFAFDTLYRYLKVGRGTGLLVIADQKHLLYKSEMVARLNPRNAATVVRLDTRNTKGFEYRGYARRLLAKGEQGTAAILSLLAEFDLDAARTTLIGPHSLLDSAEIPEVRINHTEESLVCSAPFAVFADGPDLARDYLLLCQDETQITALGFKGTEQ